MNTLLIVLGVLVISAYLTGIIRFEFAPKVDEKMMKELYEDSVKWWKR